jgi:general secretion pathway protein N
MLRSKGFWLTAGTLIFLLWLIATIPARLVLAHVSNAVPMFYAEGVSGTIWSGSAARIVINAAGFNQDLGETHWQLHPSALLLGRLSVSLDAKNGREHVTTDASVSLGGRVTLANTDISLPASIIRSWAPLPAQIDGTLSLQLKSLAMASAIIDDLNGVLTWQDAQVDFSGTPIKIGGVVAQLSLGNKGQYQVALSDLGGDLGVGGQLLFMPQERNWAADVKLTPRPGLDPNVASMISQFGARDASGAISFRQSGKL